MILPKERDPRFITIRRGGTLTDAHHKLLALWAATCAEHVLELFESIRSSDNRPRHAIEQIRAWTRGDVTMTQSRIAAGHANAAARDLKGAARHAAYAAGQAAVPTTEAEIARHRECQWQRDQLPPAIRDLVLDDQHLRSPICWSVFDE